MTKSISRRGFVAGGAVAVMAPASLWAGGHLASQKLRTIGLGVTVQKPILDAFKRDSGVGAVHGKTALYAPTQATLLAGSRDFDCWETNGERIAGVARAGVIEPIATARLKNWHHIRDTFTHRNPRMAPEAQISGQIWADANQKTLWMVPIVYNFDSIGYRTDLVDAEDANTWTALFDKRWRGKTGLNVDPLVAFGEAILAMNALGLLDVPNPGNPDKRAIKEASKFLIAKKKEGQFRAIWGDFDELVGLLASGEIVLADAWQPTVTAVKAQGIPCAYAVPREGYRGWAIGITKLRATPNSDAVLAYADYWLSGAAGVGITEQGYYSPTTTIKDVLPKEKYDFWYAGKPWVGAPYRGIVEGDVRDGGALATRAKQVKYWHQWPDEYAYLIKKWDEFMQA